MVYLEQIPLIVLVDPFKVRRPKEEINIVDMWIRKLSSLGK